MALALYDRVQETTTTAGTGSLTLLGAVNGFQSFAVVGDTNTCYYTIVDGNAWEVGIGTYSTTGPTLARTTILSNSDSTTSPITLSSSANTKAVFLTYPAEKSVNLNAAGNVTPLGTISSGTWQGSTVGVAYGGTGVTASSGPNSVVLRDSFGNITGFNNFVVGSAFTTTSGGTTVLTDASAQIQAFVGSASQTVQLPEATTLSVGQYFTISKSPVDGILTIKDNSGITLTTIGRGGAAQILCTDNTTSAGSWAIRVFASSNTTWSNVALDYNGAITSATWNGDTVQPGYGGTGLTTFTGANNALYSTGASTLTAGTLPILAGGTGATTDSGARSNLGAAASGANSDITSLSGLTTPLSVSQGGTGLTSFTSGGALYATSTSALASGTLPTSAGGTGNTSGQAASVANALTAGTGISFSSGTTYNGSAAITINNSGVTSYPGAGLAVSTGSAWGTSKTAPTGDVVGTTDTQTLSAKTITGLKETKVAIAAVDIDLSAGNYFSKTVAATTAFTVSNVPTTGTAASFILDLTNGGSQTVTFMTGTKWAGGTTPTLTASGRDVLGFFTYDGGTTWNGFVLGKAMA